MLLGSFFGGINNKSQITDSNLQINNNSQSQNIKKPKNNILNRIRLKIMELRYLPHLEIRLVHDKVYSKGGKYKKWTDKPYSKTVNRGVAIAFLFSFIVFQGVQQFSPYFSLWRPTDVRAAQNSIIWTTREDFENNQVSVGSPTQLLNINTATSPGNATVKEDMGTGMDGSQTLASNSNINTLMTGGRTRPDGFATTLSTAVAQGASSITLASAPVGAFAPHDEILIARVQDTVPKWETLRVAEGYVAGQTTIPLASAITSSGGFPLGTLVQRVPNYNILTINTGVTLTANPWNGSTGGVIIFSARSLVNNGTITASGLSTITNAGNPPQDWLSGGGGGYGGFGGSLNFAYGGAPFGSADNPMLLGRAGGGTPRGAPAGLGGGIIRITANSIQNNGSILSNGGDAGDFYNSGAGGGSGGSVYISALGPMVGIGIHAIGGRGGHSYNDVGGSGGGGGRILIESTPPIASGPLVLGGGIGFGELGSPIHGGPGSLLLNQVPTRISILLPPMGIISNLKISPGDGISSRWSTISWQGVTPNNTSITFRTRGANTEVGLATATWSQPYTSSGSAITTPSSQWLEIEARLSTTGGVNTPTLNELTVTYDTLEAPLNQNIILAKTDGTNLRESNGNIVVGGATGGWSNSSALRVSASELTCTDCATPGTNIRPEVEAKPIGTPFNGQGTFAAISGNTFVDITGLTAGGYHLRVRAIDDQGRVSGWVSYGGNTDGQIDFSVDQIIPQGTISINNDAVSTREGAVTLSITASDANSRLGRLYLSNDGTNWENRTPQTGFLGESLYSGNISWDLSAGDDGVRNVYLRVVDNAGNILGEDPALSDSIDLDTQPPGAFSLVSPENNTWSSTEPNPMFAWTASSGHDRYQLFINGVLNVDNIPSNATSITASAPLLEGGHTWVVRALDVAGNVTEATGGARSYGYDFSRPTRVSGFSAPMAGATVSSILVRWNPANDAISGIEGYVLERKRYDDFWGGPTSATFNLGNITSFTDTGLESGFRYSYRVRAFDFVGLFSSEYAFTEGVTIDTVAPSVPTNVTASVTSQGENSGREIVLNWNPSFDTGTGVSKYKVWRRAETNDTRDVNDLGQEVANNANQIWTLVGVVQNTGALLGTWADNDANNDRIMDDKTSPSPRLNDFVDYFYRVVAVDVAGNHSTLITRDPVLRLPDNTNLASGRTVDITAPSIPVNITVTPTGVDTLGGEPLTQAAEITWGPSFDTRTLGRVPTGSGSGVRDYRLYMARGNVSGPTEDFSFVRAVEGTSYTKEGLGEDTFYYFRVRAIDNSDNQSAQSVFGGALTRNSQVPTTPTNVTVRSKKGDPANDNEVGRRIDISFRGSRIKGTGNRVDGYRIYRSTTNFPSQSQWLALTPIHTFSNLGIPTETQDGERTFTDTVDSDSTRYFYRVQAFGWNESNQSTEVSPSLSSIQVDVLNAGWDITPDITAPAQPQEVKVKDIHGNESLFRNIITWTRVTDSLRNEVFDFSHYEVWRYETLLGVISAVKVSNDSNYTDPGFNYFVDGIPRTEVDKDFSYFVIARDNASTEFRYANGVVINPFSNSSGFSGVASINPSAASPTVMDIQHRDIGVSAATIEWRTNQLSDSLVEFRVRGTDTVIAAGRNRTTPVTHHIVNLVGLREGTDYEYRIISRNSLGNIDTTAATEWRHFRTSEFRITDVSVETTTTTATVRWRTNIPADSNVEYKEETVFDMVQESQTAGNPNLSRDHEVVIRSLRPNTNYTYKIRSVSGDRFIVETAFASFRTRPFDASQFIITPSASNIAEQQITATSARIVWQTLIPTTTWVDYGTTSGVYSQSAGTNDFNTTHVVELKNLTPGQTYFYRVRGVDANNIEYTSREYSFTAVLEPQISDIRVELIDSFNAVISFNTNVDTEASVTYGADGRLDLKAGTTEFKRNHVINIENLEDGKTYGYFIEVRDRLNNAKRSESAVFETSIDRTGAKIENLKIDILPMSEADATASVIISWRSNKPTTTLIKYDEGVIARELRKSTVEDESFNTSHTVVIRDLNPSTTYQFRISGVDRRGNITESQNYNFVTPSQERSILQLIIRSLEETFAWTRNLGDFTRNIRERF